MNSVQIVGLIVLLTVIACAMLYFKRKEDADDLNPVKSGAPTDVDSYVASHGEPLDVVSVDWDRVQRYLTAHP